MQSHGSVNRYITEEEQRQQPKVRSQQVVSIGNAIDYLRAEQQRKQSNYEDPVFERSALHRILGYVKNLTQATLYKQYLEGRITKEALLVRLPEASAHVGRVHHGDEGVRSIDEKRMEREMQQRFNLIRKPIAYPSLEDFVSQLDAVVQSADTPQRIIKPDEMSLAHLPGCELSHIYQAIDDVVSIPGRYMTNMTPEKILEVNRKVAERILGMGMTPDPTRRGYAIQNDSKEKAPFRYSMIILGENSAIFEEINNALSGFSYLRHHGYEREQRSERGVSVALYGVAQQSKQGNGLTVQALDAQLLQTVPRITVKRIENRVAVDYATGMKTEHSPHEVFVTVDGYNKTNVARIVAELGKYCIATERLAHFDAAMKPEYLWMGILHIPQQYHQPSLVQSPVQTVQPQRRTGQTYQFVS